MHNAFGIEAKPILSEIQDFRTFLLSIVPPLIIEDHIFIYENREEAEEAADLLNEAKLLEETHRLIKTTGSEGDIFFDYGFHAGNSTFLFAHELAAFSIIDGNKTQIEMAMIQLEEHLVFKAADEIYFTINHYIELIKGIVRAYEVKVEFLDLDK